MILILKFSEMIYYGQFFTTLSDNTINFFIRIQYVDKKRILLINSKEVIFQELKIIYILYVIFKVH